MISSPHTASIEEISQVLQVDTKRGLAETEAKDRLRKYGPNALPQEKADWWVLILLRQFKNPLIFILVLAGLVTFFLREYTDTIVIFIAVILNTLIGFFQEIKASKTLTKLKNVLTHTALVIRDTNEKEIPQEKVVPGDIVLLQTGSKVPADIRIFEAWNLRINEAILTGEWTASEKTPSSLTDPALPLADRENMAYMGSTIEEGNGKGIVIATGSGTELGNIAQLVSTAKDEQTPYQKKIAKFSWVIGGIVAVMAVSIFIQGIITNRDPLEMFEIAVAIAVGAIPEGLPVALTIVLALGMQRILSKHGLVRTISSAETLGSTSVIATDKTLTLTEGKMEVEHVFAFAPFAREDVLLCASLANEAFVENPEDPLEKTILRGRPTDKALMRSALEAGILYTEVEKKLPRIFRTPFASETKYIASFHQKGEKTIAAYLAGAPERIFDLCHLPRAKRSEMEKAANDLTQKGFRVIALAQKTIPVHTIKANYRLVEHIKNDPKFASILPNHLERCSIAGLIALKDPLRKGVKEAIHEAKKAGLHVVIVTGDHVLTAKAVGMELGLAMAPNAVVEGRELDAMADEELKERIATITVFARVEPRHKLRIIEAWQKRGHIIAMTGDGVNDTPALKKADIGLALGSGTEAAKEVSDLVLLSDDFAIIPAAIKEGRAIIENMRKIITYLLSGSFTETILIGASMLLHAPILPVTALQILWINLIEDGLPGIALTAEKAEKDLMRQAPQKKNIPLLNGEMKVIIFIIGIATDFILLGLFFYLLNFTNYTAEHIQTMLFISLGADSLLYVFSCRSLRKNIWEYNPFSNTFLVGSVLLGFIGLITAVYVPLLNDLLGTVPLSPANWMVLIGIAIFTALLIELVKWYFIRRDRRANNK